MRYNIRLLCYTPMGWHSRSMRAVNYHYNHNYKPPVYRSRLEVIKFKFNTRDQILMILLGPFTCGITWMMLAFNEE